MIATNRVQGITDATVLFAHDRSVVRGIPNQNQLTENAARFLASAPSAKRIKVLNYQIVAQGAVTEQNDRYLFFVPGYGNVSVVVNLNAEGGISSVAYRPDVADFATSIADAPAAENLSAFPNPGEAGGTLHFGLHSDGNTLVELTDMTGRMVLSTSVSGNGTVGRVDIPASVTPGIYTLVTRHTATSDVRTQKVSIR